MANLGKFEEQCLLALMHAGSKSKASQVFEKLLEKSNRLDLKFGAVYTTLNRLAEKGFVSKNTTFDAGKERKVFSINGSGQAALAESYSVSQRLYADLGFGGARV